MNPTTPLHEDSLIDLLPETPHQEAQRCTRNTPSRLSGCTICPTPTNQVHNLDVELGTDDTTPNPPTSSDHSPHTQSSHPAPLYCLQKYNQGEPNICPQGFVQTIHSPTGNQSGIHAYDHSDLATCYQIAEDIINAHNPRRS